MLRSSIVLSCALLALPSTAPAQIHASVRLGREVAVHARFGTRPAVRVVPRGVARPVPRVVDTPRVVYRYVYRRVWVPGRYELIRVPAKYGVRTLRCGRVISYIIRPARIERVWRPGYWTVKRRRIAVRT